MKNSACEEIIRWKSEKRTGTEENIHEDSPERRNGWERKGKERDMTEKGREG